ncbi:MAG: pentapeptide repeat-containing protein [Planctomycetaceae bacterium]|nr:pentapeptide repeat-containing protein [Planctomycetaceae bacterium]MBT6494520.1 pentapeptide repeat-containing protein [Planctomycetaceae bacterium]
MPSTLSPQRAIVRPRVIAPDTGEVLPLDDAVQSCPGLLEWGRAAVIVGGTGVGKTTALAHLRLVLSDADPIDFLDDADEDIDEKLFAQPDCGPFAIWSVSSADFRVPRSMKAIAFRLAPWRQDEWIEYLLAVHPERCGSVISRLNEADDCNLLRGNPELWRIVLNRMAADESILNVRTALRREINDLFADAELRSIAQDYAIEALTGATSMREHVEQLVENGCGDAAFRLIRHECVRNMLAAEEIVSEIGRGGMRARDRLKRILPRELIREIACQLDGVAIEQLEQIQHQRLIDCNPMAVSILVASNPQWTPNDNRVGPLLGAFVSGVSWPGKDLSHSALNCCDFSASSLNGANLDSSRAISCNFTRSYLHEATAEKANFSRSCFNDAIASGMKAPEAHFDCAEAIACDFGWSRFAKANFNDADLTDANFRGCDLTGANFVRAIVDRVDFSGACLESAILNNLDLSRTLLTEATIRYAKLNHCNLEFVELPVADFHGAELCQAILTGSRMPRADFQDADLRDTGLAEIGWEGANLREADLRGSTFHMGSSRSGLVESDLASEGTRTGFYTDEYNEQHYTSPEAIRKANLCGADLREAKIDNVDFYLVDLRGARYSREQRRHFEACGAILSNP